MKRIATLTAIGALLAAAGIEAQPQSTTSAAPAEPELRKILEGEGVTEFEVVSTFYRRTDQVLRSGSDGFSRKYLLNLGIDSDEKWRILENSMTDAVEVLNEPLVDRSLEGSAFEKHQFAVNRRKARMLAVIYHDLATDLESLQGRRPERLFAYITEEVRPSIGVFSTKPARDPRLVSAFQEFDTVLAALKNGEEK